MRAALALLLLSLAGCAASQAAPADGTLAQRIQRLEDERAIREVLVQYGEFLEARDYRG